jgi:hypothetical protein
MTQQSEREHEDLQRLFDETAGDAAGPTLTKLAARAADIPERALRRPRLLPRWAWGPAFAGTAAALGGLLALRALAPKPAPQRGPAPSAAAPVVRVVVATASAREVNAAAPHATSGDEPGDTPELLGDADEGARFDVSGPVADRDLDAWLAATKELSGGS